MTGEAELIVESGDDAFTRTLNTLHFAYHAQAKQLCMLMYSDHAQAKQETYTTKTQPPAHALAAPDWALNNEPGHLVRVGHHTVLDLCVGVFECSVPCQPCCLRTHHSTHTVRLPAGPQIRRIKPYADNLQCVQHSCNFHFH